MTLQPSYRVPLELKAHILRFCDPSTLAQSSRVSLAFLELSSPLLYREVSIQGSEKLEKLFCSRDTHEPSLATHLSLDQIETFAFKETRQSVSSPPVLHRARFGSPTLSVTRLSIFLPPERASPSLLYPERFIATLLLPLFSPELLYVEGLPASRKEARRAIIPTLSLSTIKSFVSSLRTLHLKDVKCTLNSLWSCPFLDVLVVVEESDGLSDQEMGNLLMGIIGEFVQPMAGEEEQDEGLLKSGFRRLEVWVGSEERKQEWLEDLRLLADHLLEPSGVEGELARIEVFVRS